MLGAAGLVMAAVFAHFVPPRYPVGEWLLWRYALMWLYALLFTLAGSCLGHLLLSRVFRVLDRPLLETLVLSLALGVGAYGIVFHVAGAFALLGWAFPFVFSGLSVLAGGLGLARRVRAELASGAPGEPLVERGIVDDTARDAPAPRGATLTLVAALAGIFGVLALGVIYIGIMTPDAIGYDAAWQHQVVAQDYARNGKLVPFPADWAKNHPQLAAIVYAWAYIAPGLIMPERWVAALHLEFVLFVFTLAGVAAVVRVLTGDRPVRGAWAGFFLFPAIFVYDCNLQGSADHVLAFFTLPVFLAALRAGRSLAPRDMALVGAFVGAATMVKYQSMYLAGAAAIPLVLGWLRGAWLRLRRREGALDWATLARLPLIVIGAMMLASSPHFIRNAVFYGNPFYPYMQEVIASHPTYPNADFYVHRTFLDPTLRLRGKLPERIADVFSVLTTFSWSPHYFGWSRHYPAMGSLFTLCLPLSLLLPRPRRLTWIALLAGFAGLTLWTLNYRTDRNLQVMVPLFAAGTVAVLIHAWRLGTWARVGIVPLVLLQVFWQSDSIVVTQFRQINRAIEQIRRGWEEVRGETVWEDFRAAHRQIDDYLPKDAKVVLHSHHMSLGIDREVLFDWSGAQGLFNHVGFSSPIQIWQSFKDQGVTHIVSLPGGVAASTRGEDVLFAMLLEQAGQGKIIGQFRVDPLPAKLPPDGLPIEVLTLGMWGYGDGLYPVSALSVHEGLAMRWQRWPYPEELLPSDDEERIALLAKASAVLVGGRGVPGPATYSPLATVQPLRSRIERSFYRAQTYQGGLELFLRRPKLHRYPGPVLLP
ncbi:MAG: hypothetical protein ABW217_06780 [Polyangiaceae bacterium]